MEFKAFILLIESYDKDLKETLGKIPALHRKLASRYKFVFQPGNELKGDGEHIGLIDKKNKTITVAAPWVYGREMTVLHEIGHLVWNGLIDNKQQEEWGKLVKNTQLPQDAKQDVEELFCMAYGAAYAHRPPAVYVHDKWEKFIKRLPK